MRRKGEQLPGAESSKGVSRRRRRAFLGGFTLAVLLGLVFLLYLDDVMGHISTPEYCGSCHEIFDAYDSWELSPHHVNKHGVSVKCISCHLPPTDNLIEHLAARLKTGSRDLFKHYFSDTYDAEALQEEVRRTMPGERCTYCHNDLAANPSKRSIGIVHKASIEKTSDPEHACLACHTLHGPKKKCPPAKDYEKADNSFCYVCHVNWKKETFVVTHEKAGVACYDCHGISEPHMDDEEHLTPPEKMFTKEMVNASCMVSDCHPRKDMEAETGHRPFFAKATKQKHCTDCHGMHRLDKRKRRWDQVTGELTEIEGRPAHEVERTESM